MNLISAKGLNCYSSCIVSIADHFGIDFSLGFSTLWSENELTYDNRHRMYISDRFIQNMALLGITLRPLEVSSPPTAAKNIASVRKVEDVLLVGMDAFHLPWSNVYRLRRRLHYFYGIKADDAQCICFDPLYQAKYVSLPQSYIAEHAFDIRCVQKNNPKPWVSNLRSEADAILRQHPALLLSLVKQARLIGHKTPEDGIMLAKYMEALRDNRYLFQVYLQKHFAHHGEASFFTQALFAKWTAVKNGLYKMAFTSSHENLLPAVCQTLEEAIAEETKIANILATTTQGRG